MSGRWRKVGSMEDGEEDEDNDDGERFVLLVVLLLSRLFLFLFMLLLLLLLLPPLKSKVPSRESAVGCDCRRRWEILCHRFLGICIARKKKDKFNIILVFFISPFSFFFP